MKVTNFAAAVGGIAIAVSGVIVCVQPAGPAAANGDSGDSSTTGYVTAQPTVPSMNTGSTVTETASQVVNTAPSVLQTVQASPSEKATPAADCGQSVHPGGGPFECP